MEPHEAEKHLSKADLILLMQAAAPPGQDKLSPTAKRLLRRYTKALLLWEITQFTTTFRQFMQVRERGLNMAEGALREAIEGKTVVVVGGTGCIGSTLMRELMQFKPGRLIGVSRGQTAPIRWPEATYRICDIRQADPLRRLLAELKPDIVYHVAAQRDPALAEKDVIGTLSTNIFGTRNLIQAVEESGVPRLVYASTGKAVRPFTVDVYAASKKIGEHQMAELAARGTVRTTAARFTHVVNNSIIEARLRNWIKRGQPIRLHGTGVAFFVQSARESAHLLMDATLREGSPVLYLHAIRNLGWPVHLLDLSLGAMWHANKLAPIYFCGYEQGYEEQAYPGLYHPAIAGSISPLISWLETSGVASSATCPAIDVFSLPWAPHEAVAEGFRTLQQVLNEARTDAERRSALNALSWAILESNLQHVPHMLLERIVQWMDRHTAPLSPEHARITDIIRQACQRARCS